MLKAVIDTNVFVSALIGGRRAKELLTALREGKYRLIISPELLGELVYVLSRPVFNLTPTEVNKVVTFLETRGQFVRIRKRTDVCRDPSDNKVLETALSGKADFIVTGDKDLLVLKTFRNIRIITPQMFSGLIT